MRVGAAIAFTLVACRANFDPIGEAGVIDAFAGDAPIATSCMGLPATCGPAGTNDCCETIPIPGGTFIRGFDRGTDGMYPDMTATATISGFWLDKYEVTVARFRRFVMAGQGTQQNPPGLGAGARFLNGMANQAGWQTVWSAGLPLDDVARLTSLSCNAPSQTWTNAPDANESKPMNCINWFEAQAFCIWDGGFLPTEAEWNYVATGGAEQRAYPWSSPPSSLTIDCAHANYYNDPAFCTDPPNGAAAPVGSRSPLGDGRWGHADLAGNEWEWTLDLETTPYPIPCVDCAELTAGGQRVTRGGYFKNSLNNLRAANRSSDTPENVVSYMGVRCARK